MSSKAKGFDAVAAMREIRDKVSAQIANMTLKEQLDWMASREISDPVLTRLRQRAAQQGQAAATTAGRNTSV